MEQHKVAWINLPHARCRRDVMHLLLTHPLPCYLPAHVSGCMRLASGRLKAANSTPVPHLLAPAGLSDGVVAGGHAAPRGGAAGGAAAALCSAVCRTQGANQHCRAAACWWLAGHSVATLLHIIIDAQCIACVLTAEPAPQASGVHEHQGSSADHPPVGRQGPDQGGEPCSKAQNLACCSQCSCFAV